MLAEDNADDAELTLMAFSQVGVPEHEIAVAVDGAEALSMIDKWVADLTTAMPTLTLLDLKLPKHSGLEVLRRIRSDKRTHHMPVVILTSSLERNDTSDAYELGVNAYVRKPVDYPSFVELVRTMTRFWLEMNEPPTGVGRPSAL
jgi:two-component system, response regulator